MPEPIHLASRIEIRLNGASVERSALQQLQEAVVDQNVYLPGMFSLRFSDPKLQLIDNGPFDLTKKVTITADTAKGDKVTLIEGEITALEPVFEEGMIAELVVRGFDASHRLYRETKSKAHINKKDSDLAKTIASTGALGAVVDSTPTVYEHIYQHNESDLAFLMHRAWKIGYECFVADKKLYFRKPQDGSDGLKLTWGDDLLSFRPRMTLAEQVDQVIVKGWDVKKKEPITGKAQKGKLYPEIGESKNGAGWASSFGNGKLVIVDQPVISQAEADIFASARLDEISGGFLVAEGLAFRRPDIQAGRMIRLEGLGKRFSGNYRVSAARHVYTTAEGLFTTFSVNGSRTGLLSDQMTTRSQNSRWSGVVPALVTATEDPDGWGRVKVKYPWMAEDAASGWARVIGIGAGPEAGLFVMPEVGDEVLVTFAFGDFNQPYILGGLWNGKSKIPPPSAKAEEGKKPQVRTMRSRSGHYLAFYDDSKKMVEIQSAGGHVITLSDQSKKIEIKTAKGNVITFDDNTNQVDIESKGKLNVKVGQDMAVDAKTGIKITANTDLTLESKGSLKIKATQLSLEGSAMTEIKGGLVKIN